MKVFFSNTAPIVKHGIGQAFAAMGHKVCYANVLIDHNWQYIMENFQPDCVFTDAGWGIKEIMLPVLKKRHIPHIYWAIEDPPYYESLSLPFARVSACIFTTAQECIPRYRQEGIDARLLLFACNPDYHRRVKADRRFHSQIAFVGNNYFQYNERLRAAEQILKPLLESSYEFKIYGNEWWLDRERPFFIENKHYGGYLANEDLPALCASVPVILGLHSVSDSRTMMSMRTFEVLGSGGFYLTQWTPAIENLFKNHVHLVWSRSAEETLELVDYYLRNPAARERIARQGQEEVYSKHTYWHRLREILPLIEARVGQARPALRTNSADLRLRYARPAANISVSLKR